MRYKDCFDKERRHFFRAVKNAGISLGLLRSSSLLAGVMMGRAAEAADMGPSKHCLIFSGGGCQPENWYPTGTDFPAQSAPLKSHYGNMVILKNATLSPGAGHGIMFARFDNASFGRDSFDVNMGLTIGVNYPIKYLNLANIPIHDLSRDTKREIPSISSPQAALDILFSAGAAAGTVAESRKSIVDLHYQSIGNLKNKLGQLEKDKLDSHFTAIREIESTLNSAGGASACVRPPNTAVMGFDALAKVQSDILVLALSCNLTASVSIAFGDDGHNYIFDALGGRQSHEAHHFNQQRYTENIAYMQGITKYLLDKLKGAGLLDSTIVTQISDMGAADTHGNVDVPTLVAGAGISGGRVLDVGGMSQVNLYQTIGLKLKADQSPSGGAYRNWGVPTIAGL